MATLQVRDIDDGLYETLKRHAQPGSGQCAIDTTEEFLRLSGSWQDERTANQIIKDIRAHRKNSPRFGADHVLFD